MRKRLDRVTGYVAGYVFVLGLAIYALATGHFVRSGLLIGLACLGMLGDTWWRNAVGSP